jgi:hypothetical protein
MRRMQRQARERLIQYQYYVASSYAYRMLEPCPVDYTRNQLFDAIVKLFGLDGAPPKKPSEIGIETDDAELAAYLQKQATTPPFGAESRLVDYLKLIYVNDLRTIVSLTVRGLNERRPDPIKARTVLVLSNGELEQLNRRGAVTIQLDNRVVSDSDVNSRLAHLKVLEEQTEFTVSSASGNGTPPASLEMTCEPAGRAVLIWNGTRYGFTYGGLSEASPVRWGCTWDAPTRTLRHIEISNDTRSLLAQLVDPSWGSTESIRRMRFLPGARCELVIRREVRARDSDVDITIKRLAVELEIHKNKDFTRQQRSSRS